MQVLSKSAAASLGSVDFEQVSCFPLNSQSEAPTASSAHSCSWLTVQRMARLAGAQKKVWVRCSIEGPLPESPVTVQEADSYVSHLVLHIIRYEV